MHFDCIIVGLGLSGVLLSLQLVEEGCKILIIDNDSSYAASRIAGGLMNPVTGKRLVKSWDIDKLLPVAIETYTDLAKKWNLELLEEKPILDFFSTAEQREIFVDKSQLFGEFLSFPAYIQQKYEHLFHYKNGVGVISPCYTLNANRLLIAARNTLTTKANIVQSDFNDAQLQVQTDGVIYDNYSANKIVFCDGWSSSKRPFFELLPWSRDKGECLIIDCEQLPRDAIYKFGQTILPYENNRFWVGASHDWKSDIDGATENYLSATKQMLDKVLKVPYSIREHRVGYRPANLDRKPFVGFLPNMNHVGMLNGMGGKGFTSAPYYARVMADNIIRNKEVPEEVSLYRFKRLIER